MARKVASAAIVLRTCLQLRRRESLVIVFDHLGFDVAESLLAAASSLGHANVTARFVPVQLQRMYRSQALPATLRHELATADALAVCVTDLDATTHFRLDVIKVARAAGARILHMPGVDATSFARSIGGVDFLRLHREAQSLARQLEPANKVELHTARGGRQFCLTLTISGRAPQICGGVVDAGSIMNLPTGEVYVAPVEGLAFGEVLINGATDRAVMSAKDTALLSFRAGLLDLSASVFSSTPAAQRLQGDLIDLERHHGTALPLGELGIGLNATIEGLTGHEIWDEKAAGTAHIALGANYPFGGSIRADFHRDLVFLPTRVVIDGNDLAIPPMRTA